MTDGHGGGVATVATNGLSFVYKEVVGGLYPEMPPRTGEKGDIEEGGVAAEKKETGYGQLRRVWRELSPRQIPHLFVITILAVHAIRAAAALALGALALYSLAMFVVYRDLVTGGFYTLALQALNGQIEEVGRLKVQNDKLEETVELACKSNGELKGLIDGFRTEKEALTKVREELTKVKEDLAQEREQLTEERKQLTEEREKTKATNETTRQLVSKLSKGAADKPK